MNTIQVKCYLFSNSNVSVSSKLQSEIRIFNLSYSSWDGIFAGLLHRIRSAYESILGKSEDIKVYWQDDEDELVCFSTDDELRYAINIFKTMNQKLIFRKKTESTSNNFLRIYIARKQSGESLKSKSEVKTSKSSSKTACNECEGCAVGHKTPHSSLAIKDKSVSLPHEKIKIQSLCPKKLSTALTTASQSVPIVKTDDQLKYASEVLKKIFDPFDINVAYQNDNPNVKTLKPALKSPPKEVNFINTDPEQLKKIGENIRNLLDTRGIETIYSIQNSICCNGCNEQINGVRYKCTTCSDYDLCERCEKKGVHKEHSLIKVAKRNDQANKDAQSKNLKYCFSCNDPIIGSRYKCNTCLNHEICDTCEKKGVQKPHSFMRLPCGGERDQECKLIYTKASKEVVQPRKPEKQTLVKHEEAPNAPTPFNIKIDSRSSTTPGVRFKFSSRLSYNFSENKDNRVYSRSQSRLEAASSSVEEVKVNRIILNNKPFPLSKNFEKNFKSLKKSVFSSESGSNLSTGTLSPQPSDLVVDEAYSLIKSSSTLNLKTKPTQKIDLKVLKLKTSASKLNNNTAPPSRMSSNDYNKRPQQIMANNNNKLNESVEESDYENYSKKNDRDRLNLSGFSSDVNSIHSSAFDSDIDIDKELKILDTVDRLRSMGYEGTWVKRLVNAKNGNINLVLDSINQRPVNYWAHHDPRKAAYHPSHVPSKSFRL